MKLAGTRQRLLRSSLLLMVVGPVPLPAQTVSASPVGLVEDMVRNELNSDSPTKFMYREHQETGHGWQTKLIVETKDAVAGMVVAIDGKPLTAEQRHHEEARLEGLVNNPQELKRKQKEEKEDGDRTNRMVKALPEAFLYEFDGVETGRQGVGSPGDELVRLKFRPNPDFDPPSRAEQVLTGMKGYILIDKDKRRIAEIDGTLEKDVGFGWGILGRLDKGGRFVVQQGTVGKGVWEVTRMDLDFTGRILLFKKLVIKSTEILSDFREAPPDLTFAQGVELLKKQAQSTPSDQSQR
ncbi:MAG: hypothetical protein ACLP6G_20070 [Terriglobales bacterium]